MLAACQTEGVSATVAPKSTLFIPRAERADIMWSIPPPEVYNARKMFDATEIKFSDKLPETLNSILKSSPNALIHILPEDSKYYPKLPEHFLADISPNSGTIHDQYLISALQRARLIKDADEIALIRKANEISSRAHETVMRVLGAAVKNKITREEGAGIVRPLLPGEWMIEREAEAEAIFVASCRREGCVVAVLPHQRQCFLLLFPNVIELSIKRIFLLWPVHRVPRLCITAVMTRTCPGVLWAHATTSITAPFHPDPPIPM